MKSLVTQTVTVGIGGRVELVDPDLPTGSQAEVTVRVHGQRTPAEKLAAFRALQESVKLTKDQADRWIAEIAAERQASNRPRV